MNSSRIKNIGTLEGKLLVFGGVYSNFQALEAIQQVAHKLNISSSQIINTGDIIAYCAQPMECIDSIKNWGIHNIAGNVEIQLATGQDDCACDFTAGGRCDTFSKQWYSFAQSQIDEDAKQWMDALPEFLTFEYAGKKCAVLHGSFFNTSEFIFRSTDWERKAENFEALKADVILAGHCGLPFSQKSNNLHWLNPGVIGMPANDGTPRVWYMILDDSNGIFKFEHLALEYDYKSANSLMNIKNLTPEYAKTLLSGFWDNCEILPDAETKMAGVRIG